MVPIYRKIMQQIAMQYHCCFLLKYSDFNEHSAGQIKDINCSKKGQMFRLSF